VVWLQGRQRICFTEILVFPLEVLRVSELLLAAWSTCVPGFEKKALEYWREANVEGKKSIWNDKRLEIEQAQRGDRSAPSSMQALRLRLASSEKLLLNLLDLLVDAPDPVYGLSEAVDLESKVSRLTKDVERLQGEAGVAMKESEEAKDLRERVKKLEKSLAESQDALKACPTHSLCSSTDSCGSIAPCIRSVGNQPLGDDQRRPSFHPARSPSLLPPRPLNRRIPGQVRRARASGSDAGLCESPRNPGEGCRAAG